MKERAALDKYLFCYFAGESYPDGEQIYLAVSEDGLFWEDLNGNRPVLYSNLGEKGVRDPFIVRRKDGEGFYLIATDLRVHGSCDWARAREHGSRGIIRWESRDLIHWSDPVKVDIAVPDAGCTWAPEATYDPERDAFLVYWASATASDQFAKQRIYAAYTTDFLTFGKPEVYMEQSDHIIDMTIEEVNGVYYRLYCSDMHGGIWLDQVNGLHGVPAQIPSADIDAQKRVEGPFVFRFYGKDRWCLLLDQCGGIGYYPLVTDDISSGKFTVLPQGSYRMPSRARHGSVMAITTAEYEALKSAYLNQ